MKLAIAIVDDLAADRTALRNLAADWFEKNRPDIELSFTEFDSAQTYLVQGGLAGRYSITFMDILMKGMNGIEAARRLRAAEAETIIVFMTSSREYALDAYSVHPYDFLVKPFEGGKASALLTDLMRDHFRREEGVEIRTARGPVRIDPGRIISVLSRGHAVDIYIDEGQVISGTGTFSDVEDRLRSYPRFLNINRGVLINMDKVVSVSGGSFIMSSGQTCHMRVRGQADLIRIFTQYQVRDRMMRK